MSSTTSEMTGKRYQEILDLIAQLDETTDLDEWWTQFLQSRKSMTEVERNAMLFALPDDKFQLVLDYSWHRNTDARSQPCVS